MVRGFVTPLLLAVICMISSCTVQEAIEIAPDPVKLENTSWVLSDCPGDSYLFINGYTDCEYLSNLDFKGGTVFITNLGSTTQTPHYICSVDGSKLSISIMDCSMPSARTTFEWTLVQLDQHSMVIDIEVPNIMSDYHEQFTFSRKN
jgi:hypothetical protein